MIIFISLNCFTLLLCSLLLLAVNMLLLSVIRMHLDTAEFVCWLNFAGKFAELITKNLQLNFSFSSVSGTSNSTDSTLNKFVFYSIYFIRCLIWYLIINQLIQKTTNRITNYFLCQQKSRSFSDSSSKLHQTQRPICSGWTNHVLHS